jgi:RNA polymerase sigma factor (sigma-70 family)
MQVRDSGAADPAEQPDLPHDRHWNADLYRRHSAAVHTHFRQRGVGWSDAEDLTAEVFAIAWRRRDDVVPHPTAGMLPWLLGTANHLLRDRSRSIARAHRALARITDPVSAPDIAEDLVASAQDRARIEILAGVLHQLTVPEQEVIQFCVLRGLSPGVVADVTAEPASTVRARLSRALDKARAAYAAIDADDAPRTSRKRRGQR